MNYKHRLAATLSLLVSGLVGLNAAVAQDDVLPPEQAFPYTLEASAEEITLEFQVPDGYYLYRERIRFSRVRPTGSCSVPRTCPMAKSTRTNFLAG